MTGKTRHNAPPIILFYLAIDFAIKHGVHVCLKVQTLHPRVIWPNEGVEGCSKIWLVCHPVKGLKATPTSFRKKDLCLSFYRSKIDLGQDWIVLVWSNCRKNLFCFLKHVQVLVFVLLVCPRARIRTIDLGNCKWADNLLLCYNAKFVQSRCLVTWHVFNKKQKYLYYLWFNSFLCFRIFEITYLLLAYHFGGHLSKKWNAAQSIVEIPKSKASVAVSTSTKVVHTKYILV